MQRYFISPEQITDSQCYLLGQDAHHLATVLRAKPGEEIIICTGEGKAQLVQIKEVTKEQITCQLLEELPEERELPIKVSIAQGLPKGDKLEWVVQKGTELGAHQFIPFTSARTIVKYDEKKEGKKVDRWNKIVKEAAEQSHRHILPKVEPVCSLTDLVATEATCRLIAYEQEALTSKPSTFYQAISQLQLGSHLLVVIGPEGGFALEEVKMLEEAGFQRISLGRRILRTETAAMYILAALSFYFEQIGE